MIDIGPMLQPILERVPSGDALAAILQAALEAVDPFRCTFEALDVDDDVLRVAGRDQVFPLGPTTRLLVVSVGKAALAMAQGAHARLGSRVTETLVVTKHAAKETTPGSMRILESAHPIPDRRSVEAARAVRRMLSGTSPVDVVLFLISGGASSLVTAPHDSLSLADLQTTTDALLRDGASIEELNAVRKHLDALKGGGLALAATPAAAVSLVLSDVIGDPLDVIASGPTAADRSMFADALRILRDAPDGSIPDAVMDFVVSGARGERTETPKPGDRILERVHNHVVAGNGTAVEHAIRAARARGFEVGPALLLEGEARAMGERLARTAQALSESGGRRVVVAGGETIVHVRGPGHGGRNLEVALGAVSGTAGLRHTTVLTFATDGEDGPTDAAGAVVTGDTLERARAMGLDPIAHLDRNDAYPFFEKLGDLLRTGPTGTNVCDLALCCVDEPLPRA